MAINQFMGLAEIAKRLKISPRTAQRYVARDDFPAPAGSLDGRNIWRRAAVDKWAKKTLPLPKSGRPSKQAP